jgi:hypothetical protein
MPDLTSIATTLRAGRYTFAGYLSTVPQTVVLRGTLSATPTFPAKTLAYTNVSGSYTNVVPGMTIRVLSSGVFKGLLRVATGGTIGAASLPVNEFSANTCNAASGDTIEVIREFRLWDKLVSATSAFLKDSRIAYSDQGENPPPIPCSGGAYANLLSNVASGVNFYGSTSWVVDPDSSTLTHAWDFVDGTPSTSSAADPTGVVFPAGFRMVSHTVTDDTNSKSTVQYVPVWIHDSTSPAFAVQIDSMSASIESGWNVSFKLPIAAQADIDALPDGGMIVYWEQERYNGTVASYGSAVTGRSHIKFVGYLIRSSIHIDAESDEITFEAVSPLGILEQTSALPQLIIRDNTPTKWSDLKGMTMRLATWYMLYWGSTLTDVFDFIWGDASDLQYNRLAMQETSSLAAQVNDLTASINAPLTCDRLGRLLVYADNHYLATASRAGRITTANLTTADVMELDIPQEHRGTTKHVRGEGITTASKAVFSNAGNAPSPIGTASDTLSKQIVSSQADMNTRTGFHFARVNSLHNGAFVPKGLTITLPDGYDIFDPAYREWLTLTLADTSNGRGIAFSTSDRWTVQRADVSYDNDNGTKEIRLTLDHETTGASGVTYIPPQPSENGLPDLPPLDMQLPGIGDDTIPVGLVRGIQTLARFDTDMTMHITTNFENPEASDGPAWVTTDLTTLTDWPGGSKLVAFEVDAYSPGYIAGSGRIDGFLCTDTAVMYVQDLFGTPLIINISYFRATSEKRAMRFERGQAGFGIVGTWYDTDGVYAAITTDYCGTLTETQVRPEYLSATANVFPPGVYIDPHAANTAYIAVYTTTGGQTGSPLAVSEVFKTPNAGSTWAATTQNVVSGVVITPAVVIAFADATNATIYYRAQPAQEPTTVTLQKVTATADSNVSPSVAGKSFTMVIAPRALAIPDDDANTLYLCGVDGATSNVFGVFVSHDKGHTWTTLVTPAATQIYKNVYALSRYTAILLGKNGAISYVNGTTLDSRAGNLSTSAEVIGICGG